MQKGKNSMTFAVSYLDLKNPDNFSISFDNRDFVQSAEDLYLKRDYGQLFLGLVLGVILTLVGQYWYKGGFNIPRPGSTVDTADGGKRDDTSSQGSVGTLRVRATNVRLRSCPGMDCKEITRLMIGTRVTDLGQNEFVGDQEWAKVRAGSQEGWVDRFYLE